MRFKNVVMSSVAALALASTSAMGVVTLENDGTGDYLLAPATYSNEKGWDTELKVVNTNSTHAIIARVVIRNSHDSTELFDFPLYLTPGDAWEGTLKIGYDIKGPGDKRVIVETTDDSAMIWNGKTGDIVQGNVDGPLELTVLNADPELDAPNRTTRVTDGRRSSYVEVFGIAAYDASLIPNGNWQMNAPLNKIAFFEYVRQVNEGTPDTGAHLVDINTLNAVDVDNDSLLGKQVIVNEAAKLNMAMNMTALGEVSQGARTIDVVGPDTSMNNMSDKGTGATEEMQDVLGKEVIYVMNEGVGDKPNPMRIHFTDPLKKYHSDASWTTRNSHYLGAGALTIDHYYTFSQIGHDMEENVTACAGVGDSYDISNDDLNTSECYSTPVYYEVMQLQAGGTGVDYIFNSGGFLTYTLDQNISIVPTTFSSSNLGGTYVNYHISNQSKAGL